jgi:hypothetical protein
MVRLRTLARLTDRQEQKIDARFVKNSCPSLATREGPLSAYSVEKLGN